MHHRRAFRFTRIGCWIVNVTSMIVRWLAVRYRRSTAAGIRLTGESIALQAPRPKGVTTGASEFLSKPTRTDCRHVVVGAPGTIQIPLRKGLQISDGGQNRTGPPRGEWGSRSPDRHRRRAPGRGNLQRLMPSLETVFRAGGRQRQFLDARPQRRHGRGRK